MSPRLCAFLLATTAFALDPASPVSQYALRVWRTADGLPHDVIQSLAQTRDGYLWLGTLEGLVRFDGYKFTVFDTRNTPQLKSNSIVALCERRDGSLWIGTGGGGVTVWRGGAFRETYTRANGLAHDHVRAIYEDRIGDLWITAHDGGLVRHANGRFTIATTAAGLPTNRLRAVFRDRGGTLWIGTDEEGLAVLRNGRYESVAGVGDQVRAFLEDRHGRLWVGTRGGGLFRYEAGAFTRQAGLPTDAIRALREDSDGNLWIGTDNGGITRYRDGNLATLTTHGGLPHNFVRALLEDREGNLWVGTRGGLVRLKDKRVATWTTAEGLPGDHATAVLEDAQGRVWIGSETGLGYLQGGRFHAAPLSGNRMRDTVDALLERRDGSLWIAAPTGLYRWTAAGARLMSAAPALALAEDEQGRLWTAASGGGVFADGRAVSPENATALAAGSGGAMWIGTSTGLVRHSESGARRYTTRDGLAHDMVTSIVTASDGSLWICTRGGLSRWRDGRIVSFTRRDGLLSDNVRHVVEDGRGYLWISSVRGVTRASLKEMDDFAAGRVRVLHTASIDTADGMKSAECTGDAHPAGWRARDGRLWFPTSHGAVAFDPRTVRAAEAPLRVAVERVLAGGKPLPMESGRVTVPPGAGDLEIQYTAISLAAPERLRFSYRLNGFDESWIEAGQRRSAFYTQAPPGDFRFELTAYPHEGPWPAERAALDLRVEPRFRQTLWFYVACAALAAALVTAAYRVRLAAVRRGYEAVMAERARIGQEIHDTLMQGVAGVSLQLEAAAHGIPPASESRGRIGRALDQLDAVLAEARRCVVELRSPEPPRETLEGAIRRLAERLERDHGIRATFSLEGQPRRLSETVESNLLRIAREAVSNAVRHSQAAHVRIALSYGQRRVRVEVVDDGRGFEPATVSPDRFGLRGMRERAAAMGAALRCDSAPGRGAAITVAVEDRA